MHLDLVCDNVFLQKSYHLIISDKLGIMNLTRLDISLLRQQLYYNLLKIDVGAYYHLYSSLYIFMHQTLPWETSVLILLSYVSTSPDVTLLQKTNLVATFE